MKKLPTNLQRWLFMAFVILAVASCSKNDAPVTPSDGGQTGTETDSGSDSNSDSGSQSGTNTDPFSITETFESGQKTAYAAGRRRIT